MIQDVALPATEHVQCSDLGYCAGGVIQRHAATALQQPSIALNLAYTAKPSNLVIALLLNIDELDLFRLEMIVPRRELLQKGHPEVVDQQDPIYARHQDEKVELPRDLGFAGALDGFEQRLHHYGGVW